MTITRTENVHRHGKPAEARTVSAKIETGRECFFVGTFKDQNGKQSGFWNHRKLSMRNFKTLSGLIRTAKKWGYEVFPD